MLKFKESDMVRLKGQDKLMRVRFVLRGKPIPKTGVQVHRGRVEAVLNGRNKDPAFQEKQRKLSLNASYYIKFLNANKNPSPGDVICDILDENKQIIAEDIFRPSQLVIAADP